MFGRLPEVGRNRSIMPGISHYGFLSLSGSVRFFHGPDAPRAQDHGYALISHRDPFLFQVRFEGPLASSTYIGGMGVTHPDTKRCLLLTHLTSRHDLSPHAQINRACCCRNNRPHRSPFAPARMATGTRHCQSCAIHSRFPVRSVSAFFDQSTEHQLMDGIWLPRCMWNRSCPVLQTSPHSAIMQIDYT